MSTSVESIQPLGVETVAQVAADAITEIERQDQLARAGKFGGTHTLPGGPDADRLGVLVEEVGEVAQEVNESRMGHETSQPLYDELVQVAACAIAWAAALVEETEGLR